MRKEKFATDGSFFNRVGLGWAAASRAPPAPDTPGGAPRTTPGRFSASIRDPPCTPYPESGRFEIAVAAPTSSHPWRPNSSSTAHRRAHPHRGDFPLDAASFRTRTLLVWALKLLPPGVHDSPSTPPLPPRDALPGGTAASANTGACMELEAGSPARWARHENRLCSSKMSIHGNLQSVHILKDQTHPPTAKEHPR